MQHLADIKSFVRHLLRSKKTHVLVVVGAPGWAKSHTLRETLTGLGVSYEMLGAYSTPLALFNKMAELSGFGSDTEPEVLVLDDCAGVLNNAQALSLLNAASWPSSGSDGKRRVTWTSTTDKAVTDSFVFGGKLVVLSNHMPDLPQARAFVSRALNYEIQIEADLVHELLRDAARSLTHFPDTKLALTVADFLSEQARHYEPGRISLRDLERGYEFAELEPDTWQSLLVKALPRKERTAESPELVIRQLNASGKKVGEQVEEFSKRTGLGRRRFFYLREQHGLSSETKSKAAKRVAPSKRQPVAAAAKVVAISKGRGKAHKQRGVRA